MRADLLFPTLSRFHRVYAFRYSAAGVFRSCGSDLLFACAKRRQKHTRGGKGGFRCPPSPSGLPLPLPAKGGCGPPLDSPGEHVEVQAASSHFRLSFCVKSRVPTFPALRRAERDDGFGALQPSGLAPVALPGLARVSLPSNQKSRERKCTENGPESRGNVANGDEPRAPRRAYPVSRAMPPKAASSAQPGKRSLLTAHTRAIGGHKPKSAQALPARSPGESKGAAAPLAGGKG